MTEVPALAPAALPESGGCLWWRDGHGLIGEGRAVSLDVALCPDRGRIAWERLRGLLHERRAAGRSDVALGSFTFDPRVEGSVLFVPRVLVRGSGRPERAQDASRLDRLRYARGEMDEIRWLTEVSAAIGSIRDGALEKVVLARDEVVWSKTGFSERTIAMRLAQAFPPSWRSRP